MLPRDLKPESFKAYPPEARKLVVEYVEVLRGLPLSYVPSLLREVIEYNYKFPAERHATERELANLRSLSSGDLAVWFGAFSQISLSPQLEQADWVNSPGQFIEQLSAHLWTTHQLDAFRNAALAYADRLRAAVPPEPPLIPRLGISITGQGVETYSQPVFRKLQPHGVHFRNIDPQSGVQQALEAIAARAKAHPAPFAHWYLDGGAEAPYDRALTCVSYRALEPARLSLAAKMKTEIEKPGMGPEALRTTMARLRPADLGLHDPGTAVLDRFQVRLLTEGSGTQIFSTTFAQWAARETLRRAQPLTLLVRFAPRQRPKPMNELLYGNLNAAPDLDPVGSLVDGDMGAYYNWINQQRLSGSERSSFVAWFEGHGEGVAIGPTWPRGTQSDSKMTIARLLAESA